MRDREIALGKIDVRAVERARTIVLLPLYTYHYTQLIFVSLYIIFGRLSTGLRSVGSPYLVRSCNQDREGGILVTILSQK